MQIDRAKLGLALAAGLFIFALLALLFWSFIRDTIVVPIYYLIWLGGLVIQSIPQQIYLAALVAVSLVIGYRTVVTIRAGQAPKRFEAEPPSSDSRYLHWRILCANLYASRFSRSLFASDARRLVLAILAFERGVDPPDAEALIRSGALDVPDAIRELIASKELPEAEPRAERISRWLRRLLRREAQADAQIDRTLAEIVGYVERQLEITHAGNSPEP